MLYANYVSGYRNWSGNTVTPVTLVNGLPAGGGDKVDSNTTFDLHLSYTLDDAGWLGAKLAGSQVFVDVRKVNFVCCELLLDCRDEAVPT